MSNLFNPYNLQKKVEEISIIVNSEQKEIFTKWKKIVEQNNKIETQLQADFLNDIFGEILEYSYDITKDIYNLKKEQKTEVDGQKPDGVLGFFTKDESKSIYKVVIELKGIGYNLDSPQNRFQDKRTPVEQAFSYASKYRGIEWVIVSNFKEIRLYDSKFQGEYYSFEIKDLENNEKIQKEFIFLLKKSNLITEHKEDKSVTKSFLEVDKKSQDEIKNKFYKEYKQKRKEIIDDVLANNKIEIDSAISKVQKLFDRLLFISFCNNNNLITDTKQLIEDSKFHQKSWWKGLISVFNFVDEGNLPRIHKFNGGLFANDEIFNNLKINEEQLESLVKFLYNYDFKNQITVNILGHIFEQSISDIEQLKSSLKDTDYNKKQSVRKKDGIFYTPEYITKYIVKEAVGGWLNEQKEKLGIFSIAEQKIPSPSEISKIKKWKNPNQNLINKYKEYKIILENIKVLDPSCGSGAFLVEVFNFLEKEWANYHQTLINLGDELEGGDLFNSKSLYKDILQKNIYGVDLNSESVQISKLSLWIKTAQKGSELTTLDNNIKVGNSLIDDATIETSTYVDSNGNSISKAFNWQKEFPEVFAQGGFDVVVGNPPYVDNRGFDKKDLKYLSEKFQISFSKSGTNKFKTTKLNLANLFIENSITILNNNAYLSLLVHKNLFRMSAYTGMRKYIIDFCSLSNLTDWGAGQFENVVAETASFLLKKIKEREKIQNNNIKTNTYSKEKLINSGKITNKEISNNLDYIFNFNVSNTNIANIIKKINLINTSLSEIVNINNGVVTGNDKSFLYDKKDKLSSYKKAIRGKDISRYNMSLMKWLRYDKNKLLRPRNESIFQQDKIIMQMINSNFVCTFDDTFTYNLGTTYAITLKLNVKNIALLFILSLLNSKLLNYFYNNKFTINSSLTNAISVYHLEQLPIPQIPQEEQQPFIKKAQEMLDLNKELHELSNKILELLRVDLGISKVTKKLEKWYQLEDNEFLVEIEKQNKNLSLDKKAEWIKYFEQEKIKILELKNKISSTDNEIDNMVYKLYNLTEEEIKTVENL